LTASRKCIKKRVQTEKSEKDPQEIAVYKKWELK
jgi:hypothetical protein